MIFYFCVPESVSGINKLCSARVRQSGFFFILVLKVHASEESYLVCFLQSSVWKEREHKDPILDSVLSHHVFVAEAWRSYQKAKETTFFWAGYGLSWTLISMLLKILISVFPCFPSWFFGLFWKLRWNLSTSSAWKSKCSNELIKIK